MTNRTDPTRDDSTADRPGARSGVAIICHDCVASSLCLVCPHCCRGLVLRHRNGPALTSQFDLLRPVVDLTSPDDFTRLCIRLRRLGGRYYAVRAKPRSRCLNSVPLQLCHKPSQMLFG